MKISIRSLTFGLAATLASAVMAQMPYTVTLNGIVPGCYAGQTVNLQTLQNTVPAYNIDIPVEPNSCTWSVTLGLTSNFIWYRLSTPCNGALVTVEQSLYFNGQDSLSRFELLSCSGVADCNGVFGGSMGPGTLCGDVGSYGLWSTSCICVTDSLNPIDCMDVAGGLAQPGTDCTTALGLPGTWSVNCTCEPLSSICQACFTSTQASNNPNGTDPIPFTANFNNCSLSSLYPPYAYSWSFDGGLNYTSSEVSPQHTFSVGTTLVCLQFSNSDGCTSTICDSVVFDAAGTLFPTSVNECNAGYWAIQAYQNVDSTGSNPGGVEPIPNEVWIWNTSTGSGNYQFLWNFGDGTTSTEAFPTHVYANGGPYVLCLTMSDDANCTSTFCDSLSIDSDGLLEGMIIDGNQHGNTNASDRAGFTLNVISELPTAITERETLNDVALWPNPVSEAITLTLMSSHNSKLELSILDLNGRLVSVTNNTINSGNNRLTLRVSELEGGMYILRINDGSTTVSRRFVKQ
ncbi:MAG: T9SS type A sorting domain-containing protein [Flavobacteriales bacterium]|nr:T9SS type A sorting domain-containing protein [Flavobacteriales bacterium]MBK7240548.1 T9SS type A sorting domain-containing protein [Flavobacteriales bacterium]MBK9535895.1 T9SS type A sorting domain-containing protein [Flavobacteriales bacterium]MBP9138618.1 T9SS type A sorting domain-containing protein [Flavobacteriales bacterium]HQV51712.1 PKD domain-containing protein [Flavobacteriales bacterium]